MNKQDWSNWRRQGIGSSDAPVIMNVSPWKTPLQLWEEKVYGNETSQTSAMKRGIEMEEAARRCFEKLLNVQVYADYITHKDRPWMRASLDGLDPDGKVLVEIKCPNKEDHALAKEGKIPDHYYPQLQHQLEVTSIPHMYYFSFDGTEGVIVEVGKDEKYLESLIKEEEVFYTKHLLTKEAPPLTDRDYTSMEENSSWEEISKRWKEINRMLAQYEKEEKGLRDALISMANGRSCFGHGVKLTRSNPKGMVDYSKISELKGINLDLYRKESSTRWTITSKS